MRLKGYLLRLIFISVGYSQPATINLREPAESTIFALKKGIHRIDTTIKYDILNLDVPNAQICMQLDNTDTQEQLLQSTCFPATGESKTLMDLPIGRFILSMLLRESSPTHSVIGNSSVTSSFRVAKVDELLPKIDLSDTIMRFSRQDTVIQKEKEIILAAVVGERTNVQVEYELSPSLLRMDEFGIWVRLINLKSNESLLKPTLISTTQKRLTFQSMSVGSYKLFLSLAHYSESINITEIKNEIYEKTEVSLLVHIKPLESKDIIPKLRMTNDLEHFESQLAFRDEKMKVKIDFSLDGLPSAIALVETCVSVRNNSLQSQLSGVSADSLDITSVRENIVEVPMKCLQPEERSVMLELGEGSYDVTIFLQLIAGLRTNFESTAVHYKIILEYPDETEEVIKERSIKKNNFSTFFQSMKSLIPLYFQNYQKEAEHHHDGLGNSSEHSFVRSVWGIFHLPSSSSELKDPFSHLLSILISKFVTVVPNPAILVSNSDSQLIVKVLENCQFALENCMPALDSILDQFQPIRFSIEKFFLISSDFFHYLMEKYSRMIMIKMIELFNFFGFDCTIQTSSPSEFLYRCVQFHALFFIVSIFYYLITVFFNKKRLYNISRQTK